MDEPKHFNLWAELGGDSRLAAGIISAALSSLTVLTPGRDPLRRYSIGATEWGQFIALFGLAAALPGRFDTVTRRLAALLGLPSAIVALNPLLQAWKLGKQLPEALDEAFGAIPPRSGPKAPPRARPVALVDMFRGVRSPAVAIKTLVYASPDGEDLTLDLYQPPEPAGPQPCVIVIHGGSWQNGDSAQLPALNTYLAARGYFVAAINYRKAPRFIFPAALDDSRAAIAFIRRNAAELGIDPEQLVLLGRSAGGHLALLTAYDRPDPGIKGVVGLYAPVDLTAAAIDQSDPSKVIADGVVQQFLGGTIVAAPQAYYNAGPLNFVGPHVPPTLLIHGGRDRLVTDRHSARLARRLQAVGAKHLYIRLPWATHGCDFFFSGPSGQVITYAVERFVRRMTGDECKVQS